MASRTSTAQTVLPDGTNATQYSFYANLPLRRAEGYRTCTCIVAVRAQDGSAHDERFDIAIDPSGSVPISVAAGPTRSSATYAHVKPPVVLYVERAALDNRGQLLVYGWAVSLTTMVTVQVFADDVRIGAAQLGGRRDDVADAFPTYSNARMSGFSLSTRLGTTRADMSTVRVQAISLNGFTQEVVLPVERVRTLANTPQTAYTVSNSMEPPAPAPAQDPRREIHLSCDQADLDADGHLLVAGWAACATGISTVTIHLDGEAIGDAELGLPRDDVGDEYRNIPMARYSGFRFTKSLGDMPAGAHRIRVSVRNGLDDIREEIRTVLVDAVRGAATATRRAAAAVPFRDRQPQGRRRCGDRADHRAADHRRMGSGTLRRNRRRCDAGRSAPRRRALRSGAPGCRCRVPGLGRFTAQRLCVPLSAACAAQRRACRAAERACAERRSTGVPLHH